MWKSHSTTISVFPKGKNEETFKLDRVGKLIDSSIILGAFYDGIFDDLMDKYEKAPDLFHYMYDVISTMVHRGNDFDIIKEKFQELLRMKNINQIKEFSWF